jgi:predicted transposase/invertase (TIGR01784 family)
MIDNICKYLAEEYPVSFVHWLLPTNTEEIQVLKTELSLEPIRADSVTFLQVANQILHLEFQTEPASEPPMPLRMLDYWVRLHRQYRCDIEQVVIFLTRTSSQAAFTNQFTARNTQHRYRVIRMWEQNPAPLLANPELLPLAVLAKSETPNNLLEQVATQVASIELPAQRQNLSACIEILAGLRFEATLIQRLFREEIMRESVIYQEIIQRGIQQGIQQGQEQVRGQEALAYTMRLLTRRFGEIKPQLQSKIRGLSVVELENLGEALFDFSDVNDLVAWLENHQQ